MRRNGWRSLAVALVAVPLAVIAPPADAARQARSNVRPCRPRIAGSRSSSSSTRPGTPLYRVSHNGAPLLADSALGFQFAGRSAARRRPRRAAACGATGTTRVWRPVWGEYKTIRNHYNELTVDLRERVAPRRALQLVFRVFDDGVGFRYVLPRQRAMNQFAITVGGHRSSSSPTTSRRGGSPPSSAPAAATRSSGAARALSEMDAAATPVTIDAGDAGYATLHEANLIDYAAMNVAPDRPAAPALRSALVALARRRQGARHRAAQVALADARHRRHARGPDRVDARS